ncbi:MAG: phosphotransferase enzyme family protein [Thermotogota bacterium]
MMKMSTMTDVVTAIDEEGNSKFAEKIAELWNADTDSVKYFRSSANFIFIFKKNGEYHFLRFNRDDERNFEEIKNEIEIINLLREQTDNIVEPVKSINDVFTETLDTELGKFYAVVFKGLQGKEHEIEELENQDFFSWGKSLGNLHKSLSKIPAENIKSRKTFKDHLSFIKNNLPDELKLKKEFETVKAWIEDNMDGKVNLIHFDFELDNLKWNDGKISILDFDDMALYPFEADIAFALRDLFEEKVDVEDERFKIFIEGYKTEFDLNEKLVKEMKWFLRFHDLLLFTKLKRTTDIHKKENAPDSLINLNNYLLDRNKKYEKSLK